MKEYLIAVDLEGVHGVRGLPYEESPAYGITRTSEEYARAVLSATEEVNTTIDALFAVGADSVIVWDNHGGGGNLDFSLVDGRAKQYVPDNNKPRMEFFDRYHFDGMLYIGYHSRAGSLRGVMSHTYNSQAIQYYKINGKQVGEFDFDNYIAAHYGVPSVFAASDDVCVGQMLQTCPNMETVVTKIGVSRRQAQFRNKEEVLSEIHAGVRRAIQKEISPVSLTFPCELEVRYTRQEVAEINFERYATKIPVVWGDDAHTICATLRDVEDLRLFLMIF